MSLYVRPLGGAKFTPDAPKTAKAASRSVVFLHGFMGSSADWVGFDVPEGCVGLGVDLPGHGASVGLPVSSYHYSNIARILAATMDTAGVQEMDLVGYSMGGRAALAFASAFPNRVRRLILESASPGISSDEQRRARSELDAQRAAQLRHDPIKFSREWLELDMFASLKLKPEIRNRLLAERATGNPEEWARAIEGLSVGNQPNFLPWMTTTDIPITCITGSLDRHYTDMARTLNRKNKRIRHEIVLNAGHNVHLEETAVYLELLLSLLSD